VMAGDAQPELAGAVLLHAPHLHGLLLRLLRGTVPGTVPAGVGEVLGQSGLLC